MMKRRNAILYCQKARKTALCLSLVLVLIVGIFGVCGSYSAASMAGLGAKKPPIFTVFVKKDGLYLRDLAKTKEEKLVSSQQLKKPRISAKGNYAAYLNKDSLYVVQLSNPKERQLVKKNKDYESMEISYAWYNDSTLAYGLETGGIAMLDLKTGKTKKLGEASYIYQDVTAGKHAVYARKMKVEKRQDGIYYIPQSVVKVSLDQHKDLVLIKSYLPTEDSLTYAPQIAGISKDKNYLYLWDRTSGGSFSSDGMRIGIYDLKKSVFWGHTYDEIMDLENDQTSPVVLQESSNFSPNPKNPLELAVISGFQREMYQNKAAGIYQPASQKWMKFTKDKMAAMSVQYAIDGRSIYYAQGAAAKNPDDAQMWSKWYEQEHSIYQYQTKTKKSRQLTKGHFDMLPREISKGVFTFIRVIHGDQYELWISDGTVETQLIKELCFENDSMMAGFYGGYEPEEAMDWYGC